MPEPRSSDPLAWCRPLLWLLTLTTALGSVSAQDCHPDPRSRYLGQSQLVTETGTEAARSFVRRLPAVPQVFDAWWNRGVHQKLQPQADGLTVRLDSLIVGALNYSSQVRVLTDGPLIRQTAVIEADAAFDWTAFLESRWNDLSDPVGSVLTAGPGATRYLDHDLDYSMGMRRRLTSGGRFEAAQELGWQDTSSVFFVPGNQGTARLKLNYTQPLLRGSGKVYNTSLIVLAEIDTQVAWDEMSEQLQQYLLDVSRAYWVLYRERASLLQKQRLLDEAGKILKTLEGRAEFDAPPDQVARAQSAVRERQSEVIRAETAIRNAESRIRALVGDPALVDAENLELIPMDQPSRQPVALSMRESLTTALQHRPEIDRAVKEIRAASTRLEMSQNELLPVLDLILETYVAGLQGSSDVGQAWTDQFQRGAPSYSVGVRFEVPLGNRAAQARYERRQLELRRVTNDFRTIAEMLMAEVQVAVREVTTAYREMEAKYLQMKSTQEEVQYLHDRWLSTAGDDRTGILFLEDLLTAQQRLTISEFSYLDAEVTYNLAMINLKREMGVLLTEENITIGKATVGCLPELILDKQPSTVPETIELPPQAAGQHRVEPPLPPPAPLDVAPPRTDDRRPGVIAPLPPVGPALQPSLVAPAVNPSE